MQNLIKGGSLQIRPLMVGVSQGIGLSIASVLIITTAFFFTKLSSSLLMPVTHTMYGLCALWAGWVTAKKAGSKGLIYGVLAGVIFFLVSALAGLLLPDPATPMTTWWKKLLYAVFGGAVGGIGGVAQRNM